MQWWVFVPVIAMAFWPSVETRSIVNGTSLSCGDPKFKGIFLSFFKRELRARASTTLFFPYRYFLDTSISSVFLDTSFFSL